MTIALRLALFARSHSFIALVTAAITAILTNWTSQTPYGYNAGYNDHSVLSLEGLRWADPTKFVNDWFMDEAPQPHWFFDSLTFIGQSTGLLSEVYFAFWLGGLIIGGYATAIFARRWIPRQPLVASIAFAVIISLSPWAIVGSASTMIATALPTVVAGHLLYLFLASLLTGRRRIAAVAAVLVGVVHVQQGAVVVVILVVSAIVELAMKRRMPWSLAVAAAATSAVVAFGLWLRPVASNLADFVVVCDTIIPYHCAAHTWSRAHLVASAAFIVLSALSIFYVSRRRRIIWLTTVGLAAFGLMCGLVVDALSVPFLGTFAQATNIYRLAVVLLPFAIWGLLLPVLRPRRGLRGAAVILLWFGLAGLYICLEPWQLGSQTTKLFLVGVVLVLVLASTYVGPLMHSSLQRRWLEKSVTLLVTAAFLVTSAISGGLVVRPLDITFVPDRALAAWGERVESLVPSGEIILAPSPAHSIRLVTGRAVIADCKTVPYGGDAWTEWKERIDDLGGFDVCLDPGLPGLASFDAHELNAVAEKYDAEYMVISPEQAARESASLEELGWHVILEPTPGMSVVLLEHRS